MERQAQYAVKTNEVGTVTRHISSSPKGSIEEAAKHIIDLDAQARNIALNAKERTQAALEVAYECGLWLNYAKTKMPHGSWLPWLQGLGVQPRQAQRYIGLTNTTDRSHLLTARNVTHAMELAGIRKPEPTKADPDDTTTKTRLPETIETITLSFKRWKAIDFDKRFDKANDALLLAWHDALKPMADAFAQVREALR